MAFIDDLLQAIKTGNNALATQLISECNDVDKDKDKKDGMTALGHVVKLKNKEVAKLLLDKGASMLVESYFNATAIHYAAALGDMDMVELLVQRGGDINATTRGGEKPIHWAARENRSPEKHELMLHKFIDLGVVLNAEIAITYGNSSLLRGVGYCKVLAILGDKLDWSQKSLNKYFEDAIGFNMLFESNIYILQVAAMLKVLSGLIHMPNFKHKDKYIAQVSEKLYEVLQDTNLNPSVKVFDIICALSYCLEACQNVPEELQHKLYVKIENYKKQLDKFASSLTTHFKAAKNNNLKLYFKSTKFDEFHLDQLESYGDILYYLEGLSCIKELLPYIKGKFQGQYAQLGDSVEEYIKFAIVKLPTLIDDAQESHEAKLKFLYEEIPNEVARGYLKKFVDSKIVALKVLYWSQYKFPNELKKELSYFFDSSDESKSREDIFNELKLLPPNYQMDDGTEENIQAVGEGSNTSDEVLS